jgi:hypothetical protein
MKSRREHRGGADLTDNHSRERSGSPAPDPPQAESRGNSALLLAIDGPLEVAEEQIVRRRFRGRPDAKTKLSSVLRASA